MNRIQVPYRILTASLWLMLLFITLRPAHGEEAIFKYSSPPEGWPPYVIVDSPQGCGIMNDVMMEVLKTYWGPSKQVLYPEKRNRMLLVEGGIDAYPKAKEWVDHPEQFDWTDPVVISTDILVYSKLRFPNGPPTQLDGLNIGVILGYEYPTIEPLFKSQRAYRRDAKSTQSLLRMVQRGHVDAAVTNRIVADWIIKTNRDMQHYDFIFQIEPVDSVPYRFAVTKARNHADFIKHFNKTFATMKKDGRFQAILSKYK